jgi:medium-chain acyl-[acyl-carrier-protein] hydrolase
MNVVQPEMQLRMRPRSGSIACFRPRPEAKLRLFCFAHAGGSAAIYRRWGDVLPPEVEVCAIEMPGHGFRHAETPYSNLVSLIARSAEDIVPELDRPFAFFGHSLGGLLCFELVQALRREGRNLPTALFISASRAPQLPLPTRHIHRLPDHEFVQAIGSLGGIPPRVLDKLKNRQFMLPALRADLAMFETYNYQLSPPLGIPIHVFGGTRDGIVGLNELEPWQEHTDVGMSLNIVDGDHFSIIKDEKTPLVSSIAAEMCDWLGSQEDLSDKRGGGPACIRE